MTWLIPAAARPVDRNALVRAQPLAGKALGFSHVELRHFAGQLLAILQGGLIAAQRGKIEPFVRRDQVRLHVPARAVHQSKFKKSVNRARLGS